MENKNEVSNVNEKEKNKTKCKSKKFFLIVSLILILLFSIHKIIIVYKLKTQVIAVDKLKTQVIAVVRFEFNGLENMFHDKYEYYAITKDNKTIRISRNDMNNYNENYSDNMDKYNLEKDNTYMLSCFYGEVREDDNDFKFLTSDEKRNIEAEMKRIYKIMQESYGEDYFILYTDKNNYVVENESNNSSTIYRYKDGELIKMMDCPKGKFYYIYFIK